MYDYIVNGDEVQEDWFKVVCACYILCIENIVAATSALQSVQLFLLNAAFWLHLSFFFFNFCVSELESLKISVYFLLFCLFLKIVFLYKTVFKGTESTFAVSFIGLTLLCIET